MLATETWRLSVEPHGRSGADNMAEDEALLLDADRTGRAFLRLYRWTPACLSLGRNEPALSRYDRVAIARLGIDVVRRPTGGRAVWHEHEVTYAVAAPITLFGSLRESHRLIHERIVQALRTLGVPAAVAPDRLPVRLSDGPAPCFAAPVGGEVLVNGKKVVGSAQVRLGRAFLQHGSILLAGSQDLVAAVSYQPSAVSGSTTLSEILGRRVTFSEVVDAVVRAWAAPGWIRCDPPRPTSTVFTRPSWTWRR